MENKSKYQIGECVLVGEEIKIIKNYIFSTHKNTFIYTFKNEPFLSELEENISTPIYF